MAETDIPQPQDVAGEFVLYDEHMTRAYIADGMLEERSALRILLMDLDIEVIGEAADWGTTLAQAPNLRTDVLLIDWSMLPRTMQSTALEGLRRVCSPALAIVLISHLDARQQAAISSGADTFISKSETPERVAEHLRSVAARMQSK
ncbi:MAG: response regulator transcription factor [Chloroflexota bacterium]|nr:response regulator transcription factor [Anaerolineales bacterium]